MLARARGGYAKPLTPEPVRIAAFDLDHTVVDCDSQESFVRFLSEKRLAPASLLLEVAFWFGLNRLGWKVDVPVIHARLLSRLSRVPRSALQHALREFAGTRLTARIRQDAGPWISRARNEGCHIVLLSASIEPIVAPIAASIGADGFACTRVAFDRPGPLVVEGDMIYGEAKVRALQDYANTRFQEWRLEYAFGNDYADRFLLSAATHPVAVCPSPRLRELAELKGWPRETWQ